VSLGCHVQCGIAISYPHPSHVDLRTLVGGVNGRLGRLTPLIDRSLLRVLRNFVRVLVRRTFTPCSSDTDLSVDTWLSQTSYTLSRKTELKKLAEQQPSLRLAKKYSHCKSFVKSESYPVYKPARIINSRSDRVKVILGPYFKAIENCVYKHADFIKHVPVKDRAKYIFEHFSGAGDVIYTTDYTAFENSFVPEIMFNIEFQLYKYMVSRLPGKHLFNAICGDILAGRNVCHLGPVTFSVNGVRMSGEMNTSLGNTFSNWVLTKFLTYLKTGKHESVRCLVEGDDGLFVFHNKEDAPQPSDYARLGFIMKQRVEESLETASFCGLVADKDELITVTDPIEEIFSFGWCDGQAIDSSDRRLMQLVRAKSYSLIYQYPGCPIVNSLARYGLRASSSLVTAHDLSGFDELIHGKVQCQLFNNYYREKLSNFAQLSVVAKEPGPKTRALVARLYNLPVVLQIEIERYLDSLTTLQPLQLPQLKSYVSPDVLDYSVRYIRYYAPGTPWICIRG
jgi:hypothetical protein